MKTFPWFLVVVMMGLPLPAAMSEGEEPIMMTKDIEISTRTKMKAKRYGEQIENGRLAERTDQALDAMIRLAVYKLNRVGKKKDANILLREWEDQWSGYLTRTRGIGDHAPMSAWLSEKYRMLEFTLGKDVVYTLRLSDIHTINHALPVVFKCVDNVDEMEYFLHFVHDDSASGPYRGLTPVVAYWTSFFACVGFTWGTGFMLCAPVSEGISWFVKSVIGPKLNEWAWKKACGINRFDFYQGQAFQ